LPIGIDLSPNTGVANISLENKSLQHVLQSVFGHYDFKPGQEMAIQKMISGEDTIVLIPTGGGKTVTYVLPCILTQGIAVVISPLIMLMSDQVSRLQQLGINPCYYNTTLSDSERSSVLHNLKQLDCQYQFVFVSPEAVITDSFQSCLDKLNCENRLSFFIVDEAHCINTWGREFRPAYQKLGVLRKYNVPVAALTGTATKQTLDAIKSTLQIKNPQIVKMPCKRDNLVFTVVQKKETKSKQQICRIIEDEYPETCGIIYCATQSDTVETALVLKQYGIMATFYHAGMDNSDRMRNASLWLSGNVNVICCTSAFGMGINKKNVRFVVHIAMPLSVEDYVQESGRGGRDGASCACILLFHFEDRTFHLCNIARMASEEEKEHKIHLLNGMSKFCMDNGMCRQQVIAEYFGENAGEPCKSCDICQQGVIQELKDYIHEARNIIECLTNLIAVIPKVKVSHLVMTYMGSKAKEIIANKLNAIPQYGKGKNTFPNITSLTKFIRHLIFEGYLRENLQSVENRMSLTHLTVGNVMNLLNDTARVLL
jgi:RecQ family ATP-dependent DNA helicase